MDDGFPLDSQLYLNPACHVEHLPLVWSGIWNMMMAGDQDV